MLGMTTSEIPQPLSPFSRLLVRLCTEVSHFPSAVHEFTESFLQLSAPNYLLNVNTI